MKPSFCWRSLAIGQIALVSSSRTAFPVLDVVVACPELSRRDEVRLLIREPVVRSQHPVNFDAGGWVGLRPIDWRENLRIRGG
jgi:hypothetical protein